MTMDLAAARAASLINPERGEAEGTFNDSGMQGYWRKPDGTITTASVTANGMRVYPRKKFFPLWDYGNFTLSFNKAKRWDPMLDPYRLILENGGIREFGREQIVELNWHRTPHPVLKRAIDALVAQGHAPDEALVRVMPQLDGFVRVDVACSSCPGRVFNTEGELRRHEILHKEDVQTRRLGDSISKALAGGQQASTETLLPVFQMLAEAVSGLATSQAEMQANFAALLREVKAVRGK